MCPMDGLLSTHVCKFIRNVVGAKLRHFCSMVQNQSETYAPQAKILEGGTKDEIRILCVSSRGASHRGASHRGASHRGASRGSSALHHATGTAKASSFCIRHLRQIATCPQYIVHRSLHGLVRHIVLRFVSGQNA